MYKATLKGPWPNAIWVQGLYDQDLVEDWLYTTDSFTDEESHAEIIETFEIAARVLMKEYKQSIPFYASMKKMELWWENGWMQIKVTKKDGKKIREKAYINYTTEELKDKKEVIDEGKH